MTNNPSIPSDPTDSTTDLTLSSSRDPLLQPPGGKVVFLQQDNELTFAVPHIGFRGTALFFLLFGGIWTGVSSLIFIAFLAVAINSPHLMNLLPLFFILIFMLTGLACLVASIQIAYRKAVMVASPEELVYTQKGPIRNAEYVWPRDQLAGIRVGDSGTVINGRALHELQIWKTDGAKHGFFEGLGNDELEWLALTLRQFYAVPTAATPKK